MNRAQHIIKILEDFVHHGDDVTLDKHETLTEESNDHYKGLKPDQKSASGKSVANYSDQAYADINPYLRNNSKHFGETPDSVRDDIERHVHNLKQLTKNPTENSFTAYRRSSHIHPRDLQEDDIIHDRGFTSVSLEPASYKHHAKYAKDNPSDAYANKVSLFKIHVTPGTRGHYIGDQSAYPEEKEFLLHPGTHFQVGKTHKDENGGIFTDLHIHHQED